MLVRRARGLAEAEDEREQRWVNVPDGGEDEDDDGEAGRAPDEAHLDLEEPFGQPPQESFRHPLHARLGAVETKLLVLLGRRLELVKTRAASTAWPLVASSNPTLEGGVGRRPYAFPLGLRVVGVGIEVNATRHDEVKDLDLVLEIRRCCPLRGRVSTDAGAPLVDVDTTILWLLFLPLLGMT